MLSGIRILDLTWVWSGPLAGRILVDLGAEVIHIVGRATVSADEISLRAARMMGIFPENHPGEAPWNRRSPDNDFNRGKLGLTLELNTSEGIDLFKRLVKISDVVLENFSPRVMSNFDLEYPVLKEMNPGIIMCSMPGYGLTGPFRDYVSYGTNLDHFSGLSSLMGYGKEGAHMSGNAYPDPAAALHATGAILTAVFHKLRTGQGQHIDLSQAESATSLIGESVLGYALNGQVPPRMGNRHPVCAPQGCYPCKGEDQWVAIAVSSDREWEGLCKALKHPDWITEKRFIDPINRWKNQDELDEIIEAWTRQHSHFDAMHLLQDAGVPAGAVLDAAELLDNEHLLSRGFFCRINHPECGPRKYCGLPIRFSNCPQSVHKPAPCLGEHNVYILDKLLGLSKDDIARLEEKNIIGTWPEDY